MRFLVIVSPAALIRARSDQLFPEPDEQARHHGWTVETGQYGLGCSYRDPRFPALRALPSIPPSEADDSPKRGTVGGGQQAGGGND
jgi:hypothetical protein